MAQRAERIADFVSDRLPAVGIKVQLLCEDHVGTYVLPFLCVWTVSGWANAATKICIGADVLGWRLPKGKRLGLIKETGDELPQEDWKRLERSDKTPKA